MTLTQDAITASNVTDESKWADAKKAALKSHKESDSGFYAIVTDIYKKMGGEFTHMASSAVTEGDLVTAGQVDVIMGRAQAFEKPETKWKQGEEVMFTFMPKGVHTINAGFRGKTINLTVQVDKATTNAVQASLDAQRTKKPRQKPYGCVEHREQEASVIAHGFRWSDDEGVLLAAEPTALGERNVNGKIHWSWSPSFFTDADYAKAKELGGVWTFPNGVRGSESNPARVTGVAFCVGTLTNNPAFHEMPPVKASEAVTAGAPAGNKNAAGKHKRKESEEPNEKMAIRHFDAAKSFLNKPESESAEQKEARLHSHSAYSTSGEAWRKGTHEAHEKAFKAHQRAGISHDIAGNQMHSEKHGDLSLFHHAYAKEMINATDHTMSETTIRACHEDSSAAYEASHEAHELDTPQSHEHAAGQHELAAASHRQLALDVDPSENCKKMYHEFCADGHDAHAELHREAVTVGINKDEDEKPSKPVKASGTAEGAKKGWDSRAHGGSREEVHHSLMHAVTEHDRKESKKKHYNPHGLPLAMEAADRALEHMSKGVPLHHALKKEFTHTDEGSFHINPLNKVVQEYNAKKSGVHASDSASIMDRISASGTAEGVRKAWLARHRGDKRPPIPQHPWHMKSDEALHYISKDAHAAAEAMHTHGGSHLEQENKYRDQVHDAQSILHWRSKGGTQMPEVPHSAYEPNVAASDSASVLDKLDAKKQETNEILDTVRRRFLGIESKVTAAGTSEGASKGWEKRHQFQTASAHATALHKKAIESGKAEHYNAAEKAHGEAYAHHFDAIDEIIKNKGENWAKQAKEVSQKAKDHKLDSWDIATRTHASDASSILNKIDAAGTSEGVKKGWQHRNHAIAFHSDADKRTFLKKAKADESEYSHHGEHAILTDSEELSNLAKNSVHTYSIATKHGTTYQRAGGSMVHPDYLRERSEKASKHAENLSKIANENGSASSHMDASDAHLDAAAASDADRDLNPKSSYHSKKSDEHRELAHKAPFHASDASASDALAIFGNQPNNTQEESMIYNELITAAGTSEGVRKAWEKRHQGGGSPSMSPSSAQYERNEMMHHHTKISRDAAAPLSDRKEAEASVHEHMKSPEHFASAADNILSGNYGRGAQKSAEQAMASRGNRAAMLTQLVGHYEHNSPQAHTNKAYNKLEQHHKDALAHHMGEVMKRHDESVLHASAKASASDIMSRITAKGTSEGAEKGWQARKTGSGADFHIGNNVWVHRHGMDENGNHSVYVSKGPNERARKIQTASNVPSMHGAGGHISHEAAKEIIAHVEKHF